MKNNNINYNQNDTYAPIKVEMRHFIRKPLHHIWAKSRVVMQYIV